MAKAENNGTARWVRWCLGVLVGVLLAVAAVAATNRDVGTENRTNIENIKTQLDRIEAKVDRALAGGP